MYSPSLSLGTVLIVDDDVTCTSLLAKHLVRHGFSTVTADSGLSGLAKARDTQPDIILLDVLMPGLSGLETAQLLKADPDLHLIPILFISSFGTREDKIAGYAAGAADYLTKPFELAEVAARVRTHCETHRLRHQLGEATEAHARLVAELKELLAVDRLPDRATLLDRLAQE